MEFYKADYASRDSAKVQRNSEGFTFRQKERFRRIQPLQTTQLESRFQIVVDKQSERRAD